MSITRIPGIPYNGAAPQAQAVAAALSQPPKWVVIHDTSGDPNTGDTAIAEAHYAATRTDPQSNWTSAHAYIDNSGPLGSLLLTYQAWASFSEGNTNGVQVEMCGSDGNLPAATIANTARLVATICDLFSIPKTKLGPADLQAGKRGICGHWDLTQAFPHGGAATHTDPGPTFDWASFINQVIDAGLPPTMEDEDSMGTNINSGFGFDENGNMLDPDLFTPLVTSGNRPFKTLDIWTDWPTSDKAGNTYDGYHLRVAAWNGSGYDIQDVKLTGGAWYYADKNTGALPANCSRINIARRRASATDARDNHPIGWAVSY